MRDISITRFLEKLEEYCKDKIGKPMVCELEIRFSSSSYTTILGLESDQPYDKVVREIKRHISNLFEFCDAEDGIRDITPGVLSATFNYDGRHSTFAIDTDDLHLLGESI